MKQLTIGRNKDNDIVIDDQSVSRYHATIVVIENGYILTDNNSSNGTFINGNRINGEAELHENDIVKLGSALLPWMRYTGLRNEDRTVIPSIDASVETIKLSNEKETSDKRIPVNQASEIANDSNYGKSTKKQVKIEVPEAPKNLGNSVVKKTFGTFFLLIGIGLLVIGVALLKVNSVVGVAALISGIFLFIIGIVRVSTKSKSQIRREAEVLAHNKFQSAIIKSMSEDEE